MKRLVNRLHRGSTDALSEIMRLYTPYVYTIASNILSAALPQEDIDEVVADTFISLWNTRDRVTDGKLLPYIAAIARNKSKDRLRSMKIEEPFSDEYITVVSPAPEGEILHTELSKLTRKAVDGMGEPDGEIFRRHYFLYQKTEDIAAEMGMTPTAVRSRLSRGKNRLKKELTEMGVQLEDLDN